MTTMASGFLTSLRAGCAGFCRPLIPLLTLICLPLPLQAASPLVAIDFGHTLAAHGATSARGRGEFHFNRDLGKALAVALRKRGLRVRIVNGDGRIESLQARPAAAEGAELLVSIHHDSVSAQLLKAWEWQGRQLDYNDDYAGHSLFVSRDNPDTARSILCARAIGARLQRMGFVPTHKNGLLRAYADRELAVHYYDGLAVLRHARMPALLFEAGVIKNRDEELLLADPAYQAKMADGMATAIAACLQSGVPADDEAGADRPDVLPPATGGD
ncbi:N-acetylmuramoyl-L-alanine amidase [Azoarcus indigens]|uniref:N-acetylmuramoyl-L-alanine amidase n=1 Tax=Azoarcus indigens TaxID=29545 RepID=A0A4R6ED83_9RHOO|nr:N-acetylmuramoyl-L-alanine amidase [Azoarcus indigens]